MKMNKQTGETLKYSENIFLKLKRVAVAKKKLLIREFNTTFNIYIIQV